MKQRNVLKKILYLVLGIVIVLPYIGFVFLQHNYNKKEEAINNANIVIINKEDMTLRVFNYKGQELQCYDIACGKAYGNKILRGDMKTPEGIFHISNIENASEWKHNFKDGAGEIENAYGPWFIRLDVPNQKGIGIHGTHRPESISTRDTEGCIRLRNEDIDEFKNKYAHIGMVVIVIPSRADALCGNIVNIPIKNK